MNMDNVYRNNDPTSSIRYSENTSFKPAYHGKTQHGFPSRTVRVWNWYYPTRYAVVFFSPSLITQIHQWQIICFRIGYPGSLVMKTWFAYHRRNWLRGNKSANWTCAIMQDKYGKFSSKNNAVRCFIYLYFSQYISNGETNTDCNGADIIDCGHAWLVAFASYKKMRCF